MKTYYVPKNTETYADALMAFGLAVLLDRTLQRVNEPDAPRRVEIADAGGRYEIRAGQPLSGQQLGSVTFFSSPAPYLTSGKEPESPPNTPKRDVDETWERVHAYNEQRSALFGQGLRGTDIQKQLEDREPPPDWQVVAFLGDWRMQARGIYNRFVSGWAKGRAHFAEHLSTILALYDQPHVKREEVLKKWKKLAKQDGIRAQDTASQLLNPHQGKGLNETKANALRMDNIKNRPWPEEILKAIGLWRCLVPRQTTDTKDWKVYVIAPRAVRLGAMSEVYRDFNKHIWRERRKDVTSLKSDITAILLFYCTWLDYVETIAPDEDNFDAAVTDPKNAVHGFYVAQFKLLSRNAYTLVNQSFIGLPSWGKTIHTRGDMTRMKDLINEHLAVIRGIDETHSDGYDLLRNYRDFVAGENWEAFFDFAAAYAHEIMRRYNQGANWVPTFSTTHLRRLFMSGKKPLSAILENQGFQHVAYAIRHSTIVPQGRKARQQENLYDVRYGLGAELKRKATVRDEFVAALTDFMQSYNQENVQTLENTKQQMRKDLRTTDIEDVIRLVDEYGSELVANLLVAYGYAREKEKNKTEVAVTQFKNKEYPK